jgi:hypothetical protein
LGIGEQSVDFHGWGRTLAEWSNFTACRAASAALITDGKVANRYSVNGKLSCGGYLVAGEPQRLETIGDRGEDGDAMAATEQAARNASIEFSFPPR